MNLSSIPLTGMTNCHECGRLVNQESHFCQYCGHDLPSEERKRETELENSRRQRPELPIIGGVLVIISSVFIFVSIWLVLHQRDSSSQEWIGGLLANWPDWYLGLLTIFGIVGIIGGLSSMARKSQELAIAGALLSCFGIGMAIGVIGLALIAVSEDEFKSSLSDHTERPEDIESRALNRPGFGWRH